MQLSSIDMNLLVVLDTLLEECSVTRAAARLGLSPSAVSHALGRLRDLLGDPLFVRARGGLTPTPRAQALQTELRESLDRIRLALVVSPEFDPAHSSQTFSLSCQDVTQIMLLRSLLREFNAEAPNARLDIWPQPRREQVPEDLEQGTYDLAVGQFPDEPSAICTETLFEDRVACLVRDGHPRIGDTISREEYVAEGHLAVSAAGSLELPFLLDRLLEQIGIRRRIVASVRSLVVAPVVVAHTDLICTSVEAVVGPLAADLGVRFVPMPVALPAQLIHAAWHARTEQDPAHRWFRNLVIRCARAQARV